MRFNLSTPARLPQRGHLFVPCFSGPVRGVRCGVDLSGERATSTVGERSPLPKGKSGYDGVHLLSCGALDSCEAEELRRVGGKIGSFLADRTVGTAIIDATDVIEALGEDGLAALTEGAALGHFRFNRHKTKSVRIPDAKVTLVVGKTGKSLTDAVRRTNRICDATNYARALGHEPANIIDPVSLAAQARSLAKATGLKCTIVDDRRMKTLKMGAFLAVGQASVKLPRLIVLEHNMKAAGKPIVLIGKAITFDTGGYSLKDKNGIVGMKYDKCGGMAVMGAMKAVAEMKLKRPVVGLIAAAENMIAGNAYRPNDIITSMSGQTIEIISTDAEGRLVLADSITYAQKFYKPKVMIDLATLTGGVVISLGKVYGGLFCNNDGLRDALLASGARTYERLWPMPIDDDYFALLRSDDCDFKNSGNREGHASQGAVFLKQFVDAKIPWAHLDIAGVADLDKAGPYCPVGGTGFGVRLLCDYLQRA